MSRILLVGIATVDLVNEVAGYPPEDAEIRALAQSRRVGGNAANTARVLRQYGHDCDWFGTLADDEGAAFIRREFAAAGVDCRHAPVIATGSTPTSYITLSRQTGSRTIVHYRNLPELRCDDCAGIDFDTYDWLHCEGRNIAPTVAMLRAAGGHQPVSIEIEKPHPDIENLLPHADILFFSRHYAQTLGYRDPREFLDDQATMLPTKRLFCAWGERGAGAIDAGQAYWEDAVRLPGVVDSIGAGDTFNAAIIAALLAGRGVPAALREGVHLAARKCAQPGFSDLLLGLPESTKSPAP